MFTIVQVSSYLFPRNAQLHPVDVVGTGSLGSYRHSRSTSSLKTHLVSNGRYEWPLKQQALATQGMDV